MARTSLLFYLPNTSTLLARSAIDLLKGADQAALDEAIQTLLNRNLAPPAVMAHLEQNVNFSEVLEKLSAEWSDETVRAFAAAFVMDAAKKNLMDLIVAIAILNEVDLESELRAENTPQATPNDLLENRRITWQYPPPGTVLNPPYVVLVAVEQVDTTRADSEIQSILGELVDYKGFRIARRAPSGGPTRIPGRINPDLLNRPIRDVAIRDPRINEALKTAALPDDLSPFLTGAGGAPAPSSPASNPLDTVLGGAGVLGGGGFLGGGGPLGGTGVLGGAGVARRASVPIGAGVMGGPGAMGGGALGGGGLLGGANALSAAGLSRIAGVK